MPLSSELKKPDCPSGERKGWMCVCFCQDDPGSATLRAFARAPSSSSGRSNSQTAPPASIGPASVINRFPSMSVAKWQKSGASKDRERSFRQPPGVLMPSSPT